MVGTLHLIGVGPGDPELLTLKAARLLDEMPVIAYVTTGGGKALALEIAQRHCNPHADYLPLPIPMGTDRAPAEAAYDAAAAAILGHLTAGEDVAYLCEGDPLFYGSAMYLLQRLSAVARVVVVPGVTSLTAAAAAIPLPLASRNDILKVLPATLSDERLRAELSGADAVAIIKVGRHFDRIRASLAETGRISRAVVVEHATTDRQRITRVEDFAYEDRPYFSVILSWREATE
jgi:precorrin-2/cobalt-factor-2 C20-methyltransferase